MSEKLSDRLESMADECAKCAPELREAAAIVRAVEGAATVRVPKGTPGKLLYLPVSHGFAGQRIALVPLDAAGSAEGRG